MFYTAARYWQWYFKPTRYASKISASFYPVTVFAHQTPLLRQLKDVEMWMQHNKVINLRIAVPRLNGVVIEPGETFSFWKLVGKPTRAKGYVDGMVLFYGRCVPGVGGGLCQLSNLIYWLTLHTPLTVTERHRHNYDVFPDSGRTQPFGSGATCVYNYVDLQIKNNTDQPYQLKLEISGDHLSGEWRTTVEPAYRYEVYQKEHWITHEPWGGYIRHNTIYRKVYTAEQILVADEYITENHAIMMYQPFLTEGLGNLTEL
ncbi:MAG: VanW family protein [Firmicutes bacterium]|jgi:vancomycin resistance protein VanW|nr:VanW family protein [Bacillota bacterium]